MTTAPPGVARQAAADAPGTLTAADAPAAATAAVAGAAGAATAAAAAAAAAARPAGEQDGAAPSSSSAASRGVADAVARLLRDDTFHDVAFVCAGGEVVTANRSFLAARNDYFAALLFGPHREAAAAAAATASAAAAAASPAGDEEQGGAGGLGPHRARVALPAASARALRRVLAFLHTGELPPEATEGAVSSSAAAQDAATAAAAAAAAAATAAAVTTPPGCATWHDGPAARPAPQWRLLLETCGLAQQLLLPDIVAPLARRVAAELPPRDVGPALSAALEAGLQPVVSRLWRALPALMPRGAGAWRQEEEEGPGGAWVSAGGGAAAGSRGVGGAGDDGGGLLPPLVPRFSGDAGFSEEAIAFLLESVPASVVAGPDGPAPPPAAPPLAPPPAAAAAAAAACAAAAATSPPSKAAAASPTALPPAGGSSPSGGERSRPGGGSSGSLLAGTSAGDGGRAAAAAAAAAGDDAAGGDGGPSSSSLAEVTEQHGQAGGAHYDAAAEAGSESGGSADGAGDSSQPCGFAAAAAGDERQQQQQQQQGGRRPSRGDSLAALLADLRAHARTAEERLLRGVIDWALELPRQEGQEGGQGQGGQEQQGAGRNACDGSGALLPPAHERALASLLARLDWAAIAPCWLERLAYGGTGGGGACAAAPPLLSPPRAALVSRAAVLCLHASAAGRVSLSQTAPAARGPQPAAASSSSFLASADDPPLPLVRRLQRWGGDEVIECSAVPHVTLQSARPLPLSGRHCFCVGVESGCDLIWLGLSDGSVEPAGWGGKHKGGWLLGSNDALCHHAQSDRSAYATLCGLGKWGDGARVGVFLDCDAGECFFALLDQTGAGGSGAGRELRPGFSSLPTAVAHAGAAEDGGGGGRRPLYAAASVRAPAQLAFRFRPWSWLQADLFGV